MESWVCPVEIIKNMVTTLYLAIINKIFLFAYLFIFKFCSINLTMYCKNGENNDSVEKQFTVS